MHFIDIEIIVFTKEIIKEFGPYLSPNFPALHQAQEGKADLYQNPVSWLVKHLYLDSYFRPIKVQDLYNTKSLPLVIGREHRLVKNCENWTI